MNGKVNTTGQRHRQGICDTELFMDIIFIMTCLPNVSHYGVYVRIPGRTTIIDGDEMDLRTRVHLSGTYGLLKPHPISSGNKCH
jgi:hypothetical protein